MIYYITYSYTPDDDAPSLRSCHLAKIFKACGWEVTIVGMGNSEYLQYQQYDELSHVSLRIPGRDILTRVKNFFGFKTDLEFIDIGTPERLKRAKEFLSKRS